MGDLYYNELGLTRRDGSGTVPLAVEELNTTNFDHLNPVNYWTETVSTMYSDRAYRFYMVSGLQDTSTKGSSISGLAIRGGDVSAVPIPAVFWLLGLDVIGLAVIRRRKA